MLAAILFSKLTRQEDVECWEWTDHLNTKGYGKLRWKGKMQSAHRLMYGLVSGRLSPSDHVLHSCDNRRCCNPGHLFLGSNQDNIEDKCKKDRSGKKLSIGKVRKIKAMLATGELHRIIAKEFDVNQSQISRIASGNRWAHVNLNEGTEAEQASVQ